ncbi:MAG: YdcH family protein [Sandaracinaceae bacterium]|nr:YdcH family protein [Sandaracinaceae bacterium]
MTRSRGSREARNFLQRRLRTEHSRLDRAIARLEAQLHLTPDDERMLKQMKKEKLLAKDRLSRLEMS